MAYKPVLPAIQIGHPLARGLIHAWTLHEGAGNATDDIADLRARGTLAAGVTWVNTKQGHAANFSGAAASYISMPSQPVANIIPAQWTIIFGYDPVSGADRPVFGFLGSGSSSYINPVTSYDSYLIISNGTNGHLITALAAATAGQVNVYAITDDGTNYTVYKDLVQATQTGITYHPGYATDRQFNIGGSGYSGIYEDNCVGRFLWFYIYDRALSLDEQKAIIQDPYQMLRPRSMAQRFYSGAASTPSAPTAPSSLTATAITGSRINLAWTDNSTEERFYVERSTDQATWYDIGYVSTDVTSYSDTELDDGTLYYYRVRAFNEGVFSSYSNIASATTLAVTYADDVGTVAGAYSVRLIVYGYAGECVRLRRDSDSAESDFGFDGNGDLDIAAISTWLGGANGYLVTWYDQSGNDYDMTQATGGSQPLYVASGINSKPTFDFDGSADWLAADSMAAEFSGSAMPLFASAVVQPGSVTGYRAIFSVSSSSSALPLFYFGSYGDGARLQRQNDAGGSSADTGPAFLATSTDYVWTGLSVSDGYAGMFVNATLQAGVVGPNTSAMTVDRASIGVLRNGATTQSYYDGYLSELVIYSQNYTPEKLRDVVDYQNDEYGAFTWNLTLEADNASDHLSIPVYFGTDYQAIHPDVHDAGEGSTVDGHRFWMIHTPYPAGAAAYENPSIVVSDEAPSVAQAWSEPVGITNPIDGPPGSGNYGDPCLLLAQDGDWYAYWFWNTGTDEIRYSHSEDGVNWDASAQLFTVSGEGSPAVMWDGSQYVMYTLVTSTSPNSLNRRTSNSPDSGWSASGNIAVAAIDGRQIWDSGIFYSSADSKFYGFFNFTEDTGGGAANNVMYFGESSDGTTWTFYRPALLNPKVASKWDNNRIYKGGAVQKTGGFDLWYSAYGGASPDWHTGYADVEDTAYTPSASLTRSFAVMVG